MKKVLALVLAATLLSSTACSSMSHSQKVAVSGAIAVGAIVTLIILGSKNKDRHHHHRKHSRGCRCHVCHH